VRVCMSVRVYWQHGVPGTPCLEDGVH
jgi:hypothetical protein